MGIKLAALRRTIGDRQTDIFGFTEANTCWDVVADNLRLPRQTRGWWENSQWSLSHNRLEKDNPAYQPGGTGIVCVNQVAHKTLKPGDDQSGLGRWCWTRIRGPQNFYLRIVSMYRPCVSNGPMSTYQQHVRFLTDNNRYECPRDAILSDLTREIRQWQEEGDHIIVLTDFNEDVMETTASRWATNLGLVEVVTWLHLNSPPPTFQRGRRPIDGIFIAPQLLAQAAGGYLSFGDVVPSDHRAIWIDLHLPEVCQTRAEAYIQPGARRLQCKDPRTIERYNQLLLEIMEPHNALSRINQLNQNLQQPSDLKRRFKQELNAIDNVQKKKKKGAENKCRN